MTAYQATWASNKMRFAWAFKTRVRVSRVSKNDWLTLKNLHATVNNENKNVIFIQQYHVPKHHVNLIYFTCYLTGPTFAWFTTTLVTIFWFVYSTQLNKFLNRKLLDVATNTAVGT